MLTRPDIQWLSGSVQALYAARTAAELAASTIDAVKARFHVAFGSCEEITGTHYHLHGMTTHVTLPEETPAYLHDHPMMPSVRAMPAVTHVRGRFSRAHFENTDYFNGVARAMGYNDHLILRAQGAPTTVTFSLCRDLFRPAEVAVVGLLQTHLEAAWRRVTAVRWVPPGATVAELLLTSRLQPVSLTEAPIRRLQAYFPDWRDRRRLPPTVVTWIRETQAAMADVLANRPPRVLLVEAAPGMLLLRYFPLPGGAAGLHLMERPDWHRHGSRKFSLSAREREVLHWVAQGKRDEEIGLILGLSPRTVGKHIEHLLAKLQVRNRTAAAAVLG